MFRKLPAMGATFIICSFLAAEQPAPAVFTAEQAAAGRTAYMSTCGKCHTETLGGRSGKAGEMPPVEAIPGYMQETVKTYFGVVPPLRGEKFLSKWETTQALAKRVKEAIGGFPPENTTETTHLDIAAYVLQVSGARAGSEALTADTVVELRKLNLNK